MKLLDKVDPFLSFLLELAHAEDFDAILPYARDYRIADICRHGNR
jgi:hypothetical protein